MTLVKGLKLSECKGKVSSTEFMKFRSALSNATFWKCDVYVEMLNGFLPRIAENEVLGLNVVQSIARL